MSAIKNAISKIETFVKRSELCSIYEYTDTTKVCFGKGIVIMLSVGKNRLTYKEFSIVETEIEGEIKAEMKVAVQDVVMLKQSELYTVKYHFKKAHQLKNIKTA
ncbi:hypothetical protein R4575_16970 [Acinetobacter baumannii]|nr:hypothetical protein [Acinetobacter baumannii]